MDLLINISLPTAKGGHAKWKLSWNMYSSTRCTHVFCTFGANLYVQSVLINKVSASELSPKFFSRSALSVGLSLTHTQTDIMGAFRGCLLGFCI